VEEAKRRAKVVKLEGILQSRKDAFFEGFFKKMVTLAGSIVPNYHLDGVVHDIAVNISTSDTEKHADEYKADGPGTFIVNMVILTPGVAYFEGLGRGAQKQCYVTLPNTMAGFGSSLRIKNTHGVYVLQKAASPSTSVVMRIPSN
jgi:hypothetical protein